MNVTIQSETKYTILINGFYYSGCTLESRWEGFAKFKTKDGKTVIVEELEGNLDKFFNLIFDSGETPKEYALIKATPDLLVGRGGGGSNL